jgi:hypothetical protein
MEILKNDDDRAYEPLVDSVNVGFRGYGMMKRYVAEPESTGQDKGEDEWK